MIYKKMYKLINKIYKNFNMKINNLIIRIQKINNKLLM